MLRDAAAKVEEAKLDADLRPVAFGLVLNRMLAGTGPPRPPAVGSVQTAPSRASEGPVAALAAKLKVAPDLVEQVFYFNEDGVELTNSPSALPDSPKAATGEVAYLVTAALQAGLGLDDARPRPFDEAADAVDALDGPNFTRALDAIKGQGIAVRGSGNNRSLRTNARGYEIAANFVRRIVTRASDY